MALLRLTAENGLLTGTLACFALSFFTGCAGIPVKTENGTHYLVLGIGVVSVPKAEAETDALVSKHSVLGVVVSNQPGLKFSAGLSSGSVVAVPAESQNVLIEVSDKPFGPLRINMNKEEMNETE